MGLPQPLAVERHTRAAAEVVELPVYEFLGGVDEELGRTFVQRVNDLDHGAQEVAIAWAAVFQAIVGFRKVKA